MPSLRKDAGPRPEAAPAAASPEIHINLTERHTLERLLLELQRAIKILQNRGITGVEKFRMRVLPLDDQAQPAALFDESGHQILTRSIFRAFRVPAQATPTPRTPLVNPLRNPYSRTAKTRRASSIPSARAVT